MSRVTTSSLLRCFSSSKLRNRWRPYPAKTTIFWRRPRRTCSNIMVNLCPVLFFPSYWCSNLLECQIFRNVQLSNVNPGVIYYKHLASHPTEIQYRNRKFLSRNAWQLLFILTFPAALIIMYYFQLTHFSKMLRNL